MASKKTYGSVSENDLIEELNRYFNPNEYDLSEDLTKVSINGIDYYFEELLTPDGNPAGESNLTDEEKTKLASNGIVELTGDAITNDNLKDTTKIKAVITGQVPIPDSATYEDGTVDTGVVIKYKNSEFVWVPVPDAIYDSNKDSQLPKSSATGSLTNTNHAYTPMAINTGTTAEPVYKGLLYSYNATNGAYLQYASASQYQGTTSQYREPAYLSGSSYDDNTTYGGLFTATDLQTSYNTMIASVAKYGGFFVGRYETSINETTNKAQSIADVRPSNAGDTATNRWYGLYQKQKEFVESTDKMQSEMIWGSQYDAMLNWALIGEDKAHVKASSNATHNNTYDYTTIRTRTTTETTDSITAIDRINNIYDLEGNLREWTQEANNTNYRAFRGGSYYTSNSLSDRNGNYPYLTDASRGSRLSLYIK